MARSSKPPEVREADTDYRTGDLKDAGEEILDKWEDGMTFKQLAQEGKWTAGHYSNAFYENLGPVDDPKDRTFGEIKNQYGSLKNYYEKRGVAEPEFRNEEEEIDFESVLASDELTERDMFMIKQGYKLAKNEDATLTKSKVVE